MRNGLLALAALASTTLAAAPNADACGPYEPRVLMLSTHSVRTFSSNTPGWMRRSFAVTNEQVPQDLAWSILAPGTYDSTQIAAGSAFGPAVQLSLVGPAGAQSFQATERVFLRGTFGRRDEHAALALPNNGDFRVAIVGGHDDKARFLELDQREETTSDQLWIGKQGLNAYNSYVSISPIRGSQLEVVTVSPRNNDKTVTLIRSGAELVERFAGSVIGGLSYRGMTYALVLENGVLRARAL